MQEILRLSTGSEHVPKKNLTVFFNTTYSQIYFVMVAFIGVSLTAMKLIVTPNGK